MNENIKLVIEYQKNNEDFIYNEIVEKFQMLINHYCTRVIKKYRDDLHQELLMSLHHVVLKFKMNLSINIDSSLFSTDNLNTIKESDYQNINKIMKHKYFKGFIDKYGTSLFELAFVDEVKYNELLYEYKLFCNENQFIKYLNIAFKHCVSDFYRDYRIIEIEQITSLNLLINDGKELLDTISEEKVDNEKIICIEKLSEKENDFLNLVYGQNKPLTERETANILGISQQAVHMRKVRILKKLKNK